MRTPIPINTAAKLSPVTKNISLGLITPIELRADQIALNPQTIRKTMQALEDKKAFNGLLTDERKQVHLRVNPDVALQILQVHPPLLSLLNGTQAEYALVAQYWLHDLIRDVLKNNSEEKLNCLLVTKTSPADLANIYAAAQFATCFAFDNIFSQEWDAKRLLDCFEKKPKSAEMGPFIGVSGDSFQDMRAAQNREKAKDKAHD